MASSWMEKMTSSSAPEFADVGYCRMIRPRCARQDSEDDESREAVHRGGIRVSAVITPARPVPPSDLLGQTSPPAGAPPRSQVAGSAAGLPPRSAAPAA